VFSFPNPVNEIAARVVAGGVVVMSLAVLVSDAHGILVLLAFGFAARVVAGPRFSPLGQLATRVIAPRLGPPRLVAGPPKRFAQTIGLVFSSTALILWYGFGAGTASMVVVALLACAALLESAFGICLGCIVFGLLMKAGVIPDEVCAACADISLRHAPLSPSRSA
jgi:Domain of unknown function (DUF4395)